MHTNYDIVILGAGPAGCACALALRNSGLQVALIDKAIFPRDKICGDAIPGASFNTLQKIQEKALDDWQQFANKQGIRESKLFAANGKHISIEWSKQAFNSKRVHWDDFLLQQVQQHTNTTVLLGKTITRIKRDEHKILITMADGQALQTNLIIGCDGAYSFVKRSLFATKKDAHAAVAVRAYYQNLRLPSDANYFYVNRKIAKSYLWIFPVGEGWFNVGFGIIPSADDAQVDVKKEFLELLQTNKQLKNIFEGAIVHPKVQGFKLPLYNGVINISTNNCMLCGDAANLIDPIQGHGIDKAMESGRLAAMQAVQCIAQNNFTAQMLKNYDTAVYNGIGKELHRNLKLMHTFARYPFLLNAITYLGQWGFVKKQLKKLT
jgi:menaquinone-9 beta-reductase